VINCERYLWCFIGCPKKFGGESDMMSSLL
jgi:hypothetical protein